MKQSELIELLQRQLEAMREVNTNLTDRIADLTAMVEQLQDTVAEKDDRIAALLKSMKSLEDALLSKKGELEKERRIKKGLTKLIGNKSERQMPEAPVEEAAVEEKPKFDPKTRGNNGAKRKEHFECVEEERHIYPNDPEFDMNVAREVDTHISYRYEMVPMSFKKIKLIQHIYSQDGRIMQGAMPAAPLLNSRYDGSFIAGIAQLRYLYSMPVERIVNYFKDNGFDLEKPTAHGLLAKVADMFENLYKALAVAVKEDRYLSCDETYYKVRVGDKNKDGKHIKKGYIWGVVANTSKLVYYFYEDGSRSQDVIFKFIEGYKGTLQSDGLRAYRIIGSERFPDIMRLPCLQHIKRGFVDLKGMPDADEVLAMFNKLYHKEHEHEIGVDGWTEEDNLRWRRKYAPPILRKLKKKLLSIQKKPDLLPDSDLARAVAYALNEWRDIPNIFKGGAYHLDNNVCERFNRYISLSRKNSLFFGSHAGAERGSLYYSLACSCRINGINVFDYFSDVLNRMSTIQPNAPLSAYRELLPDRWVKAPQSSDI